MTTEVSLYNGYFVFSSCLSAQDLEVLFSDNELASVSVKYYNQRQMKKTKAALCCHPQFRVSLDP